MSSLVSPQHGELYVSFQMLQVLGSKLVGHIRKTYPVHAEHLVSLLEPTIFASRSVHEDLVDVNGEVSVG